jgi:hypothetical protein
MFNGIKKSSGNTYSVVTETVPKVANPIFEKITAKNVNSKKPKSIKIMDLFRKSKSETYTLSDTVASGSTNKMVSLNSIKMQTKPLDESGIPSYIFSEIFNKGKLPVEINYDDLDNTSNNGKGYETLKWHLGFLANKKINRALIDFQASKNVSKSDMSEIFKDVKTQFSNEFKSKSIVLRETSTLDIMLKKALTELKSDNTTADYINKLTEQGNSIFNEKIDNFIKTNQKEDIPKVKDLETKVTNIIGKALEDYNTRKRMI